MQTRIRVYLAEDSPIIRRLLTELIEGAGAMVVGHADTASEAIADIAALHPDAVTIDIRLKDGTGFDVLEALAISGEAPTRIVLSNYAQDAYRSAAEQLGAEHFFDKAMQIPDVVDVVRSLHSSRSGFDRVMAA